MLSVEILSTVDWITETFAVATISENLLPNFRNENFISVFSILFPGMTGLMAGSMFVDNLRNPPRDVPLGMFSAIGVCTLFNAIAVIISGATMLRDASGNAIPSFNNITDTWIPEPCSTNFTCKYGLMNYFQVAQIEAAWGPGIIAGIFAMCLSSTMTNLDNGPQIFQAICKDQLFPFVKYFSKEYSLNIPQRAYTMFSMLTMAIILIGDLNVINGFVSNLFLAVYASVNYACFEASFAKSPGFRPSFRFYNMWLSLSGGVLCLLVMFIIDWATALLIFALFAIVFIYVHGRSGDVNWGSSIQAHHYRIALASLLSLTCTEEHVKNYRPQVLLLTGNPAARCALLDFGCAITKGDSLLIAAHIIPYPATEKTFRLVRRLNVQMTDWLRANKIKAFYLPFASTNLRAGAQNLFQTAGLGRLKPNIVLIGFKSDWNHYGIEGAMSIVDYVGIIRDAFENNCGVGILRNGTEGFDLSESLLELNISDITAFKNSTVEAPDLSVLSQTLPSLQSNTGFISSYSSGGMSFGDSFMSRASTIEEEFGDIETDYELEMAKTHTVYRQSTKFFSDRSIFSERHKSDDDNNSYSKLAKNAGVLPTEKQRKLAFQMNKFMSKVKNGRIDVWWLYDDGGLTLLIPHLLRLEKSYLEGAQLRVFTLSSSTTTEADEQRLAGLLIKFRIRFADVRIVSGAKDLPNESTMAEFKQLIQSMRTSYEGVIPGVISEHDLRKATRRTNRHLRTKEIIQKHSSAADLIIITMPIPRLEINSSLYMAWLDIMTRGLPPVLMIRGNQTSVLTFYS